MPEHDIDDLDAAFARLERDISGTTHSRGGGAAIATARRRRRRTTIGAVAAATALVVAGGAVGLHGSNSTKVDPADRSIPAPARLDASRLDTVTAGWAGPWHSLEASASPQRTLNPSCAINNDQTGSASVNGASGAFQTDDGHFVQFGATRWSTGGHAYVASLTTALEACPDARAVDLTYADGTVVSLVELPSLDGGTTEWGAVQHGDVVLELAIGPSGGLPDEMQGRLADAMVAAVQADGTPPSVPQDAGQSGTPMWMARFPAAQLQSALGTWPSGWHDGTPPDTVLHQPCGSDAWNNEGIDTSVGADGRYWINELGSRADARAGLQRIEEALAGCAGYTTRTVTRPGSPSVFVARGDRDVFAIQQGDWVVVTYLPRAATPPPDAVSAAIGSAMVGVVRDALTRYTSIHRS